MRVFCDPATAGWSLFTNGTTVPASYATSQVLAYVAPSVATGPVPYALPTGDPASANLGIAGSLAGELAAPGATDYLYVQLRAGAGVVASFTSPCFFAYDDIG